MAAGAGGLVVLGVLLTAAVVPAPARPAPPPASEHRALFEALVAQELKSREQAKEDWASQRWSQQDAFGASERAEVLRVAGAFGRFPQDCFGIIDEGIRAHWPGPAGRPLEATVVPLKPRPMD